MHRCHVRILAYAPVLLTGAACTSYVPSLVRPYPDDRLRVTAESPFPVVLADRDRAPTGRCSATRVSGRVLEVRGDTLVVGGAPRVVPAAGVGCAESPTAIFVVPDRGERVEIRQPDRRKTILAVAATAALAVAIDTLLRMAFPET